MSPIIEGGMEYQNAGAPVSGTNEVQTLEFGGAPTGGTFRLKFDGLATGPVTWVNNNDAQLIADMQAALEALGNVGTGGVVVADGTLTNGVGTVTITFGGNLAKLAVPTITVAVNALTGAAPTIAVTETTPGVTATARGAKKGAVLTDTTNAKVYVNTGTALEPVWNSVGDVTEPEIAAASLTGLVVKQVADKNVIGGLEVIHRINIAAGANGNTDVTLTHKTRVIDAWIVLLGGGVADETLQVFNGAAAITEALSVNGVDKAIVRCTSLDDAAWEVAAGGTLRVTSAGGASQPDAIVFVRGIRVS